MGEKRGGGREETRERREGGAREQGGEGVRKRGSG